MPGDLEPLPASAAATLGASPGAMAGELLGRGTGGAADGRRAGGAGAGPGVGVAGFRLVSLLRSRRNPRSALSAGRGHQKSSARLRSITLFGDAYVVKLAALTRGLQIIVSA